MGRESAKEVRSRRQREGRKRRREERQATVDGALDDSPAARLFDEWRSAYRAAESQGRVKTPLSVIEESRRGAEGRAIKLNSGKARQGVRFFHGGAPGLGEGGVMYCPPRPSGPQSIRCSRIRGAAT